MLNKQELENTYIINDSSEKLNLYMKALEEAGANMCAGITIKDEWKKRSVIYYDKLVGYDYCVKLGDCPCEIKSHLKQLTLSDLRNKQCMEVWDAVNYYQADLPSESSYENGDVNFIHEAMLVDGCFTSTARQFDCELVCTIEEFNQCVKEMSEFVGADAFVRYTNTPVIKHCLLTKENSDYSYYEKENKMIEEKPVYTQAMKDAKSKFKNGQLVYIAQINTMAGTVGKRYFVEEYWCGSLYQCEYVELGIIFGNKDDAEFKCKTLLGVDTRTPEQQQVDDVYGRLKNTKMMKFNAKFTKEMLSIIQKNGDLAEIK